jgi:ABC-2 type transport system permease protein
VIWTVAKKELRGYFNSAVAVIFLAAFLGVTFYTFFWREKFFARGIADLRPLFEWMPKLLVILVAALAMRLWSDERRAGTLEVLLTLPVARWKLVAGKFVAGMLLIAIALALTLGIPITVANTGNLDWGPVFGGYLAALLLSAAYLAIGMCVSAATDNQIVAFVGTAILCGLAYAIGSDGTSQLGRLLGTGQRFESVARGVLDLRDLAYYGSIVAMGLALNVLLLGRLTWSRGPRARNRRLGAVLAVVLIAANAVALDVWLAPVRRARLDLTQDGAYSLTASTKKILGELDEPLLIRAYFSEETHPKLAPLAPLIVDLLDEYREAGKGRVRVEVIDPTDSEEAKKEAQERFDIRAAQLPSITKTEQSVVSAYFAVGIEYGGQHTALRIPDLLDIRLVDVDNLEVKLKNVEYELTKAIKKTAGEFASIDSMFASIPGKVQLTAYLLPDTLPANAKDTPAKLKTIIDQLVKQSGGKLSYTYVEPKTNAELRDLAGRYGLEPYIDPASNQIVYFYILAQVGNRIVRMEPGAAGEAALKTSIVTGLKRAAPGFTRIVGLWTPPQSPPMQLGEGMPPQQMPPPQSFDKLRATLGGSYEVKNVTLSQPVPDDVDVLVLAGPASLDAKAVEAVDQFVMRKGTLVVLAGRYRPVPAQTFEVEKVTTGLEPLFAKWGIKVGDELVLDRNNEASPIPIGEEGLVKLDYPYFVKLTGDQLSDSVITSGLPGADMHWTALVTADAKVGDDEHVVDVLMRSSDHAWLQTTPSIQPNLKDGGKDPFPEPAEADKLASRSLAVAVTGEFASGRPPDPKAKDSRVEHSPPDSRIVVFGGSTFVSDEMLAYARQFGLDLTLGNLELVHNAVDWVLADTDLLAIRAHNAATHAITADPSVRGKYQIANLAIAFAGLALVVALAWLRRRAIEPIVASGKEA